MTFKKQLEQNLRNPLNTWDDIYSKMDGKYLVATEKRLKKMFKLCDKYNIEVPIDYVDENNDKIGIFTAWYHYHSSISHGAGSDFYIPVYKILKKYLHLCEFTKKFMDNRRHYLHCLDI